MAYGMLRYPESYLPFQACLFKRCPYAKLGMHVSSVNHVLPFHTTPLPACTYCANFSSSLHVGALSQPFYTPVYHRLQYAKTEGECYHVTHSTGSTSSTAVMFMYETNLAFCYENGTNTCRATSNITTSLHL